MKQRGEREKWRFWAFQRGFFLGTWVSRQKLKRELTHACVSLQGQLLSLSCRSVCERCVWGWLKTGLKDGKVMIEDDCLKQRWKALCSSIHALLSTLSLSTCFSSQVYYVSMVRHQLHGTWRCFLCAWRPAVWCVVRVYVYVVAGGQGHTQLKIHDDRKNKEKLRKWKKNEEKLKKIKNEEKRWKLKITKFLFQPVRTKRRTVYMFWSRRIVGSAV